MEEKQGFLAPGQKTVQISIGKLTEKMNIQFKSITKVCGRKRPPTTISVLPNARAGSGCTSQGVLCYSPPAPVDLPSHQ